MADWYSDHIGADGLLDTSVASPPTVISAGLNHGRVRYKRAIVNTTGGNPASGDVYVFFTMKSSDRLFNLMVSNDAAHDVVTACDLGLRLRGTNHDGGAVDPNFFDDAVDIATAAVDRGEALVTGAQVAGTDRGKQLWEMLDDASITTYGSDPHLEYDITLTLTQEPTTGGIVVLEAEYTAGD